MNLQELRRLIPGSKAFDWRCRKIASVTHDSRRVQPGSLFVAIPGTRLDGARFIPEALRRGAAAIVAEKRVRMPERIPTLVVPDARHALSVLSSRFHGDPSSKIRVVGVTGTNGKTTTTFLVRSIFECASMPMGLLGTIHYQVGQRRLPASTTTPDPVTLMECLDAMVREEIPAAVMEVSSHALAQSRVAGVRFETGIFTNLTGDHIDYHRDMGAYREAKGRLFRQLDDRATAILNEDDPATSYMKQITRARVIGYGLRGRGEVTGLILEMSLTETRFRLRSPWGESEVRLPFAGRHNVYNALAASAAGFANGLPLERIVRGLEAAPPVPGRQEIVSNGYPFTVMVDYAHTDDALAAILRNLRPLVRGRLIVVFGCGGDRDREKRPRMGAVADRFADYSWVTSDNPRSEEPEAIVEEILRGMRSRGRTRVELDRARAIEGAIAMARPRDLVLIAGKGHETTQTLRDTIVPFDDRIVARGLLGEESAVLASRRNGTRPRSARNARAEVALA